MKIISVLPSGPFNKSFDYLVPNFVKIKIGQIVIIPFGTREILGIVIGFHGSELPITKLKKIDEILNFPLIPISYIKFMNFFSNWNYVDKGSIIKLFLSPFDKKSFRNLETKLAKKQKNCSDKKNKLNIIRIKKLNSFQAKSSQQIINSLKNQRPKCYLLEGVPGSGKTETYFEAVDYCLKNRKQVLILLPEIGLTSEWEMRFIERFGFKPSVWHSGIKKSEKKNIWLKAISKVELVLVGARSSLFIPFQNLGLIVVDEEHDNSFKQDSGIRYHARDMAIYLASKIKIPIVLSSATPSIESIFNSRKKKFKSLILPNRATGARLPEVKIIDMKENAPTRGNWLSECVINELKKRFENKQQSMLFLNRRGYSPLTLCKQCGYKVGCDNCDTWLVEHKKSNIFLCHHCGFKKKAFRYCENCNSNSLVSCAPGIEKINEEIKTLFPSAVIENFSSDTMKNLKDFNIILKKIVAGDVDFIIGTQLLAKGYNFPKLNFVGIVDGDLGLHGGDLRASEKCFQLLMQVSGRAGRHLKKERGLVYIQTYNPKNTVLKTIVKMNVSNFYDQELDYRESSNMPPFSRLVSIILSSKIEKKLDEFAFKLLKTVPNYKDVEILGPAPAPLSFLRGRYRRRFLIKSKKNIDLNNVIKNWLNICKTPKNIRLNVDVDPYNFL